MVGHNASQQGSTTESPGDHVAWRNKSSINSACNFGFNASVLYVQFGSFCVCDCGVFGGFRFFHCGNGFLVLFFRDSIVWYQKFGSRKLFLSQIFLGFPQFYPGQGLIVNRLVRIWLDLKKQLPLINLTTILEFNGLYETRDTRAYLHGFRCFGSANEVVEIGNLLF